MKKLMCFSSIFSLVPARLVSQEAPQEAPPQPTGGKKKFKFKKKKQGDDSPDEAPKPNPKEAADKVKDASRTEQEKLKAEVERLRAENERLKAKLQKQTPGEGDDEGVEKHELSPDSPEGKALLQTLEYRFNVRPELYEHPEGVTFPEVKKALEKQPALLWSLNEMEKTGGQPDVIAVEGNTYIFADVSKESPEGEGRRNLNYDQAIKMAKKMGVQMMDPDTYRKLQDMMPLDAATWSWLLTTDPKILEAGDALLGHRLDVAVHVYEYYADYSNPDLGWRASLRVPKS